MEPDFDADTLREQPLSADEKQVLSEYFQLEGRRQFENYRSMQLLGPRGIPDVFAPFDSSFEVLKELSEKQLTLELSRRDHWINMIQSIHDQFYDRQPNQVEIMLWVSICLEKHAIVQVETGNEEFGALLRDAQHRQLPLIGQVGERRASEFSENISLFYSLLDLEGLTENLIRF